MSPVGHMDAKRRNSGPPRGGASQAKRGKTAGDWEDSPSIFEEELALFEEADMEAEEREGQAGHDVIPVGERMRGERMLMCIVQALVLPGIPIVWND